MKTDITRNTFHPRKHFSRVLKQQGRVDLDADWNEQASIVMHYLRTLATDLIGPHGGPAMHCGFSIIDAKIAKADKQAPWTGQNVTDIEKRVAEAGFFIGPGNYYVDGVLCENEGYVSYVDQPDFPLSKEEANITGANHVVYLDVWERQVTVAEDDSIREIALGGPDTATRVKTVWQVKLLPLAAPSLDCKGGAEAILKLTARALPLLRAQLKPEPTSSDACILSPESRYRGAENQLYRVEIHKVFDDGTATFKWSRENGSVIFPVVNVTRNSGAKQTIVTLAHLGRDSRLSLAEGDWVELLDDDYVLRERAESLLKVHSIQRDDGKVVLTGVAAHDVDPKKHALLRRWDHQAGDPQRGGLNILSEGVAKVLPSNNDDDGWLNLEDGVQVQFQLPADARFRTADYWLIPARTGDDAGTIEWPVENSPSGKRSVALPPHGVIHHYAPLGVISVGPNERVSSDHDCRCQFKSQPTSGVSYPDLSVVPDWPE